MSDKPLLKFPCQFPIKIMGKNHDAFELAVLTIIRKHYPQLKENAIKSRQSRDKNYLSLTITIEAQNQQHLDTIYKELTAHTEVLMVL